MAARPHSRRGAQRGDRAVVKLARLLHEDPLPVGKGARKTSAAGARSSSSFPSSSSSGSSGGGGRHSLLADSFDVRHDRSLAVAVLGHVAPARTPVEVEAGERVDVAESVDRERRSHATAVVVGVVDALHGLALRVRRVDADEEAVAGRHVHVRGDQREQLDALLVRVVAEAGSEKEKDLGAGERRRARQRLLEAAEEGPRLEASLLLKRRRGRCVALEGLGRYVDGCVDRPRREGCQRL